MIPKNLYDDKNISNITQNIWNFINQDTEQRIETPDMSLFKVYDQAKSDIVKSIKPFQYNHYFIVKPLDNGNILS